ncbi:MAG: trans-aconitate methyltransferase [Glaciecola sp.]|jgi:trans-aconitate methyltransferase
MQSLYTNGFEHIYDNMYQTFINYEEEYAFYSKILDTYHKSSVLEIGCGSGNLAKIFIESHIDYKGLDLSNDMIQLSESKNPTGIFIKGDIVDFKLSKKIDSIIITGRTTSYLLTNNDIYRALKAIHTNLNPGGVLSFDFIDATRFFTEITPQKRTQHDATINAIKYTRKNLMTPNKKLDNFMFDWEATYYQEEKGVTKKITEDNSTVRAFTKNEWELFLKLSNFKLLEIIDRKSYAFDTYVIVAQKM